ncbi:MAG: DNA repair protein RadC [Candidatus Wallbacteria bacterium]|nr:DNA repair protein RadC [Candidatus Wallbacteria bacterium]
MIREATNADWKPPLAGMIPDADRARPGRTREPRGDESLQDAGLRCDVLAQGAEALTDDELLELVAAPAGAGAHAGRLGYRLTAALGGLGRVARAGTRRLAELPGIGPQGAARLAACFELARRLSMVPMDPVTPINTPADAARLFVPVLRPLMKEVFAILCLDTKGRARAVRTVSVGSLSASIVHPREVFAEAIQEGASTIVLAHNHPSGDPSPSPEDICVTRRLVKSGDLLGIPVVDHLVVGATSVVSLKELGMLEAADT